MCKVKVKGTVMRTKYRIVTRVSFIGVTSLIFREFRSIQPVCFRPTNSHPQITTKKGKRWRFFFKADTNVTPSTNGELSASCLCCFFHTQRGVTCQHRQLAKNRKCQTGELLYDVVGGNIFTSLILGVCLPLTCSRRGLNVCSTWVNPDAAPPLTYLLATCSTTTLNATDGNTRQRRTQDSQTVSMGRLSPPQSLPTPALFCLLIRFSRPKPWAMPGSASFFFSPNTSQHTPNVS